MSNTAADDLIYLQSKGALTLPSHDCQQELIWSFFEYVYPLMPIVDLDEFVKILQDTDGNSGCTSLLLLQAILFAGTAYVKLDHLRAAGFSTRKEARKAFFQRVRVSFVRSFSPGRTICLHVDNSYCTISTPRQIHSH
jgi:hypothetical protein